MGYPLTLCLAAVLFMSGVEKTYGQVSPASLFPPGPAVVPHAVTSDGYYAQVQLVQPFHYFGRQYSTLYLSMDGFLSFVPYQPDGYVANQPYDIIAPLWTDLDVYTRGNISYEQATSGPLLQTATTEMNRMFPGFAASWVFVGTWEKVEFEPDVGEVTLQVVLVSDAANNTFILMNYGHMPDDSEPWMAGCQTQDNTHNCTVVASSTSGLSNTTNVGIPGRWAFQVYGPPFVSYSLFFPVLSSAVRAVIYDGGSALVQLQQPFYYFSKLYSQLYLSMDGFLSFEYLFYDGYVPYTQKDIIAPLWTDLDTYTRGDISYQQATSGPLLQQATYEINRMFPGSNFSASWVFVGTWAKVEFEPDYGEVTVQVVLISDTQGSSYILMNYGNMPDDPESWMAGYRTEDNNHTFTIPTPRTSDLSNSTNVGIPGRWAFRVHDQFSLFFPVPSSAVHHAVTNDGGAALVQLQQPFYYFSNQYSQLYLSMDGFLSFEYLFYDTYAPYVQKDIIAPLWTDIDTYTRGDISYQQATSGPLLQQATYEINRMFPGSNFSASWVFVGTWAKVEFEPDYGEVTFQVVLVSDTQGSSYILMNYGNIPIDPDNWMAGYKTQDNSHNFAIQTASTSALSKSSNVGIPGRWAFRVHDPFRVFFPVLSSAVRAVTYDGDATLVQLQQPFYYFRKLYSQLYLSMDGFLSFEPLYYDGYNPSVQKDIIAPLWTDLDTYTRGNITYQQATSGPLLQQATYEINHMYPGKNFSASWVFVGTWAKVEFEPDVGEVTVQVVLISDTQGNAFILMNYGDMPYDPESWMAGYLTEDNVHKFNIVLYSTSALSKSTNVGIPGRWAFQVHEPYRVFFPVLPSAVQHAVTSDGDSVKINLVQPFSFFGNIYSNLYLSMDGFLSFEYLYFDGYTPSAQKDIIAPLWTDIDTYTRGNISYEQATSGPLLQQATAQINDMFPGLNFSASWVFVGTWEKVEFEPDRGEVTFQVVLISGGDGDDDEDDATFILMNYGAIPNDPESWMAGYQTKDSSHNFAIQVTSTSDLSKSTNVGIPGRWAFRVDGCSTLNCTENEVCTTITGIQGCGCLDYNPAPNSSFDASEVCGASSGSLSLSRCQLFEAGFAADLLHLKDPTCKGMVENGRVIFDIAPHLCGTTLKSNQTHFILENAVQYFNSTQRSVISRYSWLDFTFSCAYPLIQSISMPMSIQATGSVVSKNLPSAQGTYQIRMVPYPNASFITPYSGYITLQVNQQVYVAVDLDGFDSHDMTTVLDSCWATPTSDMNNPVRWDLITNECPNPKDGTVQMLQNGVSTSSHFSFRMFTFTGVSNTVYLHCKVHLCLQVGGNCTLPCDDDDGKVAGRKRRSLDFHDTAHISMGF